MNMFDEARALRTMINMCSLTQGEIAKRMGVSQSYVANKIRLLNFSEYMQLLILEAHLTERHARLLLRIKDEELTRLAIDKIKTMKLNVRASEALIDGLILDKMPEKIVKSSARDAIHRVEEIICEAVKNLMQEGIRATKSIDVFGEKKYITICIEEKQT